MSLRGSALVLGAAVLALFWPVLIGGEVLFAGAENPVISDVGQVIHPWLEFGRTAIRAGELPAWNPYSLSGTPFFANAQAAVLGPFNLPVWLLPFDLGTAVSAALKVWVAGMGACVLVRALGLGPWPGLVAGGAYGFLPFGIVWLQFPHSSVWAFLPWMLWAGERVVQEGRARDAGWLALFSAAAFLGGHPESAVHVACVLGLYGIIRLLQRGALERRERLRRFGLIALGGSAGAMLAGAALLPILLNLKDAAWVEGRASQGQFHLPLESWRTFFFPDWWGRPTGTQLPAPANYNEGTIYPGAVALVLAGIGALAAPWRRTLPWLVLALIGLSAALGLPPVFQFLKSVPPFDVATNTRLIWLLGLAVAVLAAFGTERLLAGERPSKRVLALAGGAVAFGAIALLGLTPSIDELRLLGNHFRTGADYPEVIRLTTVVWWLLPVAGVLAVVLLRRRLGATAAAVIVLGLLALDLGHFAWGYNPYAGDMAETGDPKLGSDRVLVEALPPDGQMDLRLRDARGYDPPLPRLRYHRLWKRAVPDQALAAPVGIGAPADPADARLLRLLAVRTFIAPDGETTRDPAAASRAS
nr:hypothetical protein [Thermoleophilaceae bacterium]